MNHAVEEKLRTSAGRLFASVRSPESISFIPPHRLQQQYRIKRYSLMVATLCLVLALTLGAVTIVGQYIYIPGVSSLFDRRDGVTHSIAGRIVIEEEDITHEILSAYIQNKTLHLTVFHYRPVEGITYGSSVGSAYTVTYEGEECPQESISWGTPSLMRFALPEIPKNKEVRISLSRGKDTFAYPLTEIVCKPIDRLQTGRSGATKNGITLFADAIRREDCVEFCISAILPDGVDTSPYSIIDNHYFGFAESGVTLYDNSQKSYPTVFDAQGFEKEEAAYVRLWHMHRFVLPEELTEGTLTISSVSVMQEIDGKEVKTTIDGPWEIPVAW